MHTTQQGSKLQAEGCFYHGPNVSRAMVMWPPCWRVTDSLIIIEQTRTNMSQSGRRPGTAMNAMKGMVCKRCGVGKISKDYGVGHGSVPCRPSFLDYMCSHKQISVNKILLLYVSYIFRCVAILAPQYRHLLVASGFVLVDLNKNQPKLQLSWLPQKKNFLVDT